MVKSLRKLHEKYWVTCHSIIVALMTMAIVSIVFVGIKEHGKINESIYASEMNVTQMEKRIEEVEVHLLSQQKVFDEKVIKLENKITDIENNVQKLNDDLKNEKAKRVAEKKNNQVKVSVKKVSKVAESNGVNLGAFKVSHYTAYCKGCTGKTKTGVNVKNTIYHQGMRVIAVDPRLIPLNSVVEINDNGNVYRAIASDTGGAIKGNKLDLLVGSKGEASKLGVKSVSVKLIQSGR